MGRSNKKRVKAYNKTGVIAIVLAVAGLVQFMILTGVAVAVYPGDKVPGSFSLTQNFFSDLGMARTWTGEPNSYAAFWFNTTLTSLGVMLLPLFGILPWTGKRDSISMWFASICGIVSAIGLIGLGQTPLDEYYVLHHVALGFWLFPMFAMAMAFFFGAVSTKDMSVWFVAAALLAVVFMIVLPLVTGSTNHAINQKIIAVYGLIWFGFLIWFVGRAAVELLEPGQIVEKDRGELADEYSMELSQRLVRKKHRG